MPKIKRIFKLVALVLFLVILILLCVRLFGYAQANILCNQIRKGEDINTAFSNGTTAPIWMDELAAILQSDGPKIPLVEACYYRNVQAVKTLLQNGADPDFFIEGRMSPLEAALWNGPAGPIDDKSMTIVKMLVEAGCDVNLHASQNSVIDELATIMIHDGDNPVRESILLYLLDNGAAGAYDNDSVLHSTVRAGDTALAKKLIADYNFDVNGIGYQGQTPLILAIYYSQYNSGRSATPEMIKMLLDQGADKSIMDDFEKTASDYAAEFGYMDLYSILVD